VGNHPGLPGPELPLTEQLPAVADDSALEGGDQPASVRIIAHDLLPRVAPRHDVIDGALKFDPQSPWHVGRLNLGENDCQAEKQETKSVTAKHPNVEYDYVGKQPIPTTGLSPASQTALWAAEQSLTLRSPPGPR
jgi:hypothetical protein